MTGVPGIDGRVCVVTGGGSGIGRTISETLARGGGKVIVADRNLTGAEETVQGIKAAGGEAAAVECDIASTASVKALHDATHDTFGGCRVLVNNAGTVRPAGLLTLSEEDWNALININLTGYFRCSQTFAQDMIAGGGGAMVHVSSIAGILPQVYSGAYSVTKAGVSMLSKLIALEWGEYGIRSNTICPGNVETPLTKTVFADPKVRAIRNTVGAVKRIGTTQDMADAVEFLCSDKSAFISAQEFQMDGGMSQNMLALVPRPGIDQSAAGKK